LPVGIGRDDRVVHVEPFTNEQCWLGIVYEV
jgi:hypothetical protein